MKWTISTSSVLTVGQKVMVTFLFTKGKKKFSPQIRPTQYTKSFYVAFTFVINRLKVYNNLKIPGVLHFLFLCNRFNRTTNIIF